MNSIIDVINEGASEWFDEFLPQAQAKAKQVTPVDLGNLRDTNRLERSDKSSELIGEIIWGEQEQDGVYVNYQEQVKEKNTQMLVPNLYWIKAEQLIEQDLL
jgi:hypothetical protein